MQHGRASGPTERVPGYQPQQQRLGWHPAGQPPDTRHVAQRLNPLLEFKVPQIFLHHVGHGHSQCGREILRGHHLLLAGILQKLSQAIRQALNIARRVELDGEFFAHGHLPEVRYVG